jgi:hypothetical protein
VQSEEINELAGALSKAQGEFTAIPKGETNPFFKSKYAGLPDVIRVAGPVLAQNGLSISQFICQSELGEDLLKTYLMHSSGQFIEHSMKLYLGKLDSQGMGSATTYARRYSYMSVLGLVADEDDDGNRASHKGETGGQRGLLEPGEQRPSAQARPADSEDIGIILKAASQSEDDFLNSLAEQFNRKGSLSEKQIGAGVKKALEVLTVTKTAPKNPSGQRDLLDGEEPF